MTDARLKSTELGMVTSSTLNIYQHTVQARLRQGVRAWYLWFICLVGISALVGVQMVRQGPQPAMIAWVIYWSGIVALFYRPRFGVYLIVGWTMLADPLLMYWYPFTKNLSSAESLMFANRALVFSPLESYVALTYLSWLSRGLLLRKFSWRIGPLGWPALTFGAFIAFGLLYGLSRGGQLVIALWEVRGMVMLPALLILVNNLIDTPTHVRRLVWIATTALLLKSVIGALHVAVDLQFNISQVESIADHAFSIHLSSLVILTVISWIYRVPFTLRLLLTVCLPLVVFGIFANQRRAAFVALGIGLVLIAALLYMQRRRLFWTVVPVLAVLALIYLGAFWNAAGALGMPARAVKSIVAPSAVSSRDEASNVYRVLENINTMFTIKSSPLTGIGFGHKFYRIVSLPDISFFVFYEYITHNSVMWIWMQMGVGGFFAMIYLIGAILLYGARMTIHLSETFLGAIAALATIYVVMHFVFAYVDMSWDAGNMVYLGTLSGLLCGMERIARQLEPSQPNRWPWQAQAKPLPTF